MKAAAAMLTRGEAIGLLGGFVAFAIGVWVVQNRGERLGGRISAIKAIWLSYAITLWIGVPAVLFRDGTAFAVLAISMGVRAVVEVPLCLAGKWRVVYGVAHDLIHLLAVVAAMIWLPLPGLWVWAVLTLVSLASELVFVRWFVKATDGPGERIYFVPGGEEFRRINQRTAFILFPQAACFLGLLLLAMGPIR